MSNPQTSPIGSSPASGPETETIKKPGLFRSAIRGLWVWLWEGLTGRRSLQRLRDSLPVLEDEVQALIQHRAREPACVFAYAWNIMALNLIAKAKRALQEKKADQGWRCYLAAERFRLYGAEPPELHARAAALLIEAKGKVSEWRYQAIRQLLAAGGEHVQFPLPATHVVQASALLHEHYANHYLRLGIWRRRLNMLAVLSSVVLAAWFIYPPPLNLTISRSRVLQAEPVPTNALAGTNLARLTATSAVQAVAGSNGAPVLGAAPLPEEFEAGAPNLRERRELWIWLVLMGVLGATISGFTAAIGQDAARAKIPLELSTSTITFARVFLAAVSAVAVVMLALSGILPMPDLTFELLSAMALASGFSDRLLLRGIAALDK